MKTRLRLLAAVAGLLTVGLIVWVAFSDGDSATGDSSGAEIVSVGSLSATAAAQSTPIYWAGPRIDADLELSQPAPDRTYVRYLTGGAKAGDPRPFLTVGSYAFANPTGALRRQGKEADGVLASAPGGGVVYFNRTDPRSVYLAYPGVDVEVEVYDPDFKHALQLVTSGQIVPVG